MTCSFCGRPGARRMVRAMRLCTACEQALVKTGPNDARYQWFVRAVKRAIYGANRLS